MIFYRKVNANLSLGHIYNVEEEEATGLEYKTDGIDTCSFNEEGIPLHCRPLTGFFVLQNAQPLFCTEILDRRNYWAELAQILHGSP